MHCCTSAKQAPAADLVRPDDWRPLMPAVRAVAKEMADNGQIEVTQKGKVVDLASVKGPIRLRLSSKEASKSTSDAE